MHSASKSTGRTAAALFSKTRWAVLNLLFGYPDEAFYLRQIVRKSRGGMGATQREVQRLTEAGIIRSWRDGRLVYYQANPASPLFAPLCQLVAAMIDPVEAVRRAWWPLAPEMQVAFVSLAETAPEAITIVVVSQHSHDMLNAKLDTLIQPHGIRIALHAYTPSKFRSAFRAGDAFLRRMVDGDKQYLIGNALAIAKLAR